MAVAEQVVSGGKLNYPRIWMNQRILFLLVNHDLLPNAQMRYHREEKVCRDLRRYDSTEGGDISKLKSETKYNRILYTFILIGYTMMLYERCYVELTILISLAMVYKGILGLYQQRQESVLASEKDNSEKC